MKKSTCLMPCCPRIHIPKAKTTEALKGKERRSLTVRMHLENKIPSIQRNQARDSLITEIEVDLRTEEATEDRIEEEASIEAATIEESTGTVMIEGVMTIVHTYASSHQ